MNGFREACWNLLWSNSRVKAVLPTAMAPITAKTCSQKLDDMASAESCKVPV